MGFFSLVGLILN